MTWIVSSSSVYAFLKMTDGGTQGSGLRARGSGEGEADKERGTEMGVHASVAIGRVQLSIGLCPPPP